MGLTFRLGQVPLAIFTDSSNNVGIGAAASGSYKLQVTGTTNLTGALSGTSATFSGNLTINSSSLLRLGNSDNASTMQIWNSQSGAANNLLVYDNAASAYRFVINSSGNVGIGTSSPSYMLDILSTQSSALRVYQNINSDNYVRIDNTSTGTSATSRVDIGVNANNYALTLQKFGLNYSGTLFGVSCTNSSAIWDNSASSNGLFIGAVTSTPIIFGTSNTERMRITSGGNVGIGITNPSYLLHIPQNNNLFLGNLYITGTANNPILSSGATGGSMELDGGGAGTGKIFLQGAASGGNGYIEFRAGGALRMTIASNGNIGAPSGSNIYNASDIRLKQNVETIENGLDKIIALNPVKFNWIDGFEPNEDGKDMLGFIAQEIQLVIPEAVEKFNDNNIQIGDLIINDTLRVNEKFIIPVLVKAIQELKAEIDQLKAT